VSSVEELRSHPDTNQHPSMFTSSEARHPRGKTVPVAKPSGWNQTELSCQSLISGLLVLWWGLTDISGFSKIWKILGNPREP
jgi:hypothetical protein